MTVASRLRAAFAILAVPAIAACATFAASAGSTEGASDAGAEAGLEGGASDASDAAARFCATQDATLCADFDDVDGDVMRGWQAARLGAGGVLDLASDAYVSPPRALRARTPGAADARLVFPFPQTAHRTRLSFAMSTSPPSGTRADDWTSVVELLCNDEDAGRYDGVWLHWVAAGDGGTPALSLALSIGFGVAYPVALPSKPWADITIDVAWGSPSHLLASVDGVVVVNADVALSCTDYPRTELEVGVGGTVPAQQLYDDVVFDVVP